MALGLLRRSPPTSDRCFMTERSSARCGSIGRVVQGCSGDSSTTYKSMPIPTVRVRRRTIE